MTVPTTRTFSVRIAPDAVSCRIAGLADAGDEASSELLGAARDRIKRLVMRHTPIRERRCRALLSLPPVSSIVTIADDPRSTRAEKTRIRVVRRDFELPDAIG